MAVDQFNEAHGAEFKITMKEFDTQGDPAQAPTVLDEYIDDEDILGLVGPAFSGETKAVLPTLDEEGLVMVSASATNVELPDWSRRQVVPPCAPRRRRAGGRRREVPRPRRSSPRRIAIVHDNSEYGKGLADDQLAPLLGEIEIVATEAIDPRARTSRPRSTR